jgi:hypothetical protein
MEKPGETAGTVLVAVPGGKGLVSTLAKHGFRVLACKNLAEVIKRFDHSTDAIVLAQAALVQSKMHLLAKALGTQPPWSDVPVILLAKAGTAGKKASLRPLEILSDANVMVLPPPLRIVALLSAICSTNAKPPWPALATLSPSSIAIGATPTSTTASSN